MQKFTPFLVFLFISIAFAYGLGVQGLEEQGHRASWPKFEATIIGSEIKTGHYSEGSANSDLILHLEITVDGKKHQFKKRKIGGKAVRLKKLAANEYKTGSTITVFVNPKNPNEKLFDVHHSWGPYLTGVGVSFGGTVTWIV